MSNKLTNITNRIYIIREQKVMLDRDLAELYEVEVKALNQGVSRSKVTKCDFAQLNLSKLQAPHSIY